MNPNPLAECYVWALLTCFFPKILDLDFNPWNYTYVVNTYVQSIFVDINNRCVSVQFNENNATPHTARNKYQTLHTYEIKTPSPECTRLLDRRVLLQLSFPRMPKLTWALPMLTGHCPNYRVNLEQPKLTSAGRFVLANFLKTEAKHILNHFKLTHQ